MCAVDVNEVSVEGAVLVPELTAPHGTTVGLGRTECVGVMDGVGGWMSSALLVTNVHPASRHSSLNSA